jgi:uncharacterized protein YbjT (DUF2867 family)
MAEQIVLVTGATGKQGGATIRYLAKHGGFRIRAMTRKPSSDAAKALAGLGVEIVQGDLDDKPSLESAVTGSWGVFGVQNTWEAGVEQEEEQGKRLVLVARERGVQHFVYTSVGSAHKKTGIPHFDNKSRVEDALRAAGFPSYAILRPVFFMENLLSPGFLRGDKIMTALKPTTKLQMIAADDIGKFGASAFAEAGKWNRAEVDIAGDAVTMPDAAKIVGSIVGHTVTFEPIPIEAVRKYSEDVALMLEWFEAVGYSADIARLDATWGIRPLTLAQWAAAQKK